MQAHILFFLFLNEIQGLFAATQPILSIFIFSISLAAGFMPIPTIDKVYHQTFCWSWHMFRNRYV